MLFILQPQFNNLQLAVIINQYYFYCLTICDKISLIYPAIHKINQDLRRISQGNMSKLLQLSNSVVNFYVHIPFCIKKCHFCAFPIYALGEGSPPSYKHKMYEQYCQAVQKQINTVFQQPKISPHIQSLYFGGGTPSLLPPSLVESLMNKFKVGITKNTEISLEMNPQQLSKAQQFMNIGINRFSVGVQTLNEQTLALFNRSPLQSDNFGLNKLKFSLSCISSTSSLNIDFIVDFNHDTQDRKVMMELIKEVKPQHLSLYVLQINEGSYLARSSSKFSHKVGKYEHFTTLCNQLRDYGYSQYQVSNFCLPGSQSRHNSAYWQGDKQFGAFGMGATSLLNGYRVTRPKNISKYYKYIQNLSQGQETQAIQLLDVNYQNPPKQTLKWVLLSRLRKKNGILWSELQTYILKMQQMHKQQLIDWKKNCLSTLYIIIESNSQIIDDLWIEQGIRIKAPTGFLFADQVAYQLIQCLKL